MIFNQFLGTALQSIEWSKIFSSDLPRTLHTSEILLSKSSTYSPNGNLKLRIESLLREMNFGVKERLPRHVTVEEATEIVASQKGIPYDDVINDAETYDDVKERQHIFLTTVLYQELLSLQNKEGDSRKIKSSDDSLKEMSSTINSDLKSMLTAQCEYPKILCVTHGGFIRQFLSKLIFRFELSMMLFFDIFSSLTRILS
jgi:broad specificity phosphatase PhoE